MEIGINLKKKRRNKGIMIKKKEGKFNYGI